MARITDDIAASLTRLAAFLETDPSVLFAVVFGSVATGRMRKGSDLDIGIYFGTPPEGLTVLDLTNKLSDIAAKDVHIAILNGAPAFLRHQAMKSKINLVVKDMAAFRAFREKTILDYDEYRYVAGMNTYDR